MNKWNEKEKRQIPSDERKRPVKITRKEAEIIKASTKRLGYASRTTVLIEKQYYETTGCTLRVMHEWMNTRREVIKRRPEQNSIFE